MKTIQRIEDKAYVAFRRHQELLAIQDQVEVKGFEAGEKLYLILKYKDYETLDCNSFEEYIAWSELRMSRTTAYRLARVYRDWILPRVEQMQLEDVEEDKYLEVLAGKDPDYIKELVRVGVYKLDVMGPYITNNNTYKLLNMAATTSRSDFEANLKNTEPNTESWRYTLREARTLCERLARDHNAPLEVREYANDFLSQTAPALATQVTP